MQASDLGTDLLTIAEAAKLLKVSTATLHRWLKQGRLQAYHVGPRAVRIHRADLARLLVPTTLPEKSWRDEGHFQHTDTDRLVPPLTDTEAAAARAALHEAQAFTSALMAKRQGAQFPPSWSLIRKAREERAAHV
jgi:excisionase family DNA binding protein